MGRHDDDEDEYNIIKMLLDHGADINNMENENGSTLLREALKKVFYNPDMIKYILSRQDLDVNKKGNGKDGPIHILINEWCEEPSAEGIDIIKQILEQGQWNVNARGEMGYTPLHMIIDYLDFLDRHGYINESKDLIKLLLKLGANPYIDNNSGEKPYDNELVGELYEEHKEELRNYKISNSLPLDNSDAQAEPEGDEELKNAILWSINEYNEALRHNVSSGGSKKKKRKKTKKKKTKKKKTKRKTRKLLR